MKDGGTRGFYMKVEHGIPRGDKAGERGVRCMSTTALRNIVFSYFISLDSPCAISELAASLSLFFVSRELVI